MKNGDLVKLSPEGLRVFPKVRLNRPAPSDRRGVVKSIKPHSAGCVRVLWNDRRNVETIAAVFVEAAEEKPGV